MTSRPADVVVAPHFDDAAFSVAHALVARGPDVTVVTVCGGAPPDGAVSAWDVECGFTSGAQAAAVRAEEDRRANEIVGARGVRLGVTDAPYRSGFPHRQVVAELAAVLPDAGPLWVPAGIGGHADHVGTRDAVLALVPAASGRVRFYADCPYAFAFGWDATDDDRDEDHRWGGHLARVEQYLGTVRAHDVLLDRDAMRTKVAMLSCHRSQVRPMAEEFAGLLDEDGPLRRERYWAAAR